MGTAGRLTQHVLGSRRRPHRRKPTLRRVHHWPSHQEAQASQLDVIASRFLTPISEAPLAPRMALSATAGQVDVSTVIDVDANDAVRQASVLDMPLAQLNWRDFSRAPLIGLFYGACFALMGWLLLACFKQAPAYTLALSAGFLLMGPLLCLGLYASWHAYKAAVNAPPNAPSRAE